MSDYLLALDQGTTSSRALLFRADMTVAALAQEDFPQHFPASGWVEHAPEDLWRTVLGSAHAALAKVNATPKDIAAIGITNQRETTLIWDRKTGAPLYPAIVWQDRRTAERCAALKAEGHEPEVAARSGLRLDPYFSATKIAWVLDHVPNARARAQRGELAFGTVDSYLIWRLTGGRVHVSDATNASRTLLYNIHEGRWDDALLALFDIPRGLLPEIRDSAGDFGTTAPGLFGAPIAIRGVAGDQQAALIGQACFAPGMIKATYGTGCFALLNTGGDIVASRNNLLSTVAYQLEGRRSYALEGSIFVAGAAVQWLRDGLGVIAHAAEADGLAAAADPAQDVYLVPAFVGLGAPYWRPDVRGALFGLTRGTGPKELARAALESACFQTCDLIAAMRSDWPQGQEAPAVLRVDGGMTASDWTLQRLADLIGAPVDRAARQETTAAGAALLAGLGAGVFTDRAALAKTWRADRRFTPAMAEPLRLERLAGWRRAVQGLLGT